MGQKHNLIEQGRPGRAQTLPPASRSGDGPPADRDLAQTAHFLDQFEIFHDRDFGEPSKLFEGGTADEYPLITVREPKPAGAHGDPHFDEAEPGSISPDSKKGRSSPRSFWASS